MAISLIVDYSTNEMTENLFSYDLVVEVKAASDMPMEIFIFQRQVAPPDNPSLITDNFVCIADPVDLEEVPVNSPDIANEMPYYRMKKVVLRFRSMSELADALLLIKQDVARLVTSLIEASNLGLPEEVIYGDYN